MYVVYLEIKGIQEKKFLMHLHHYNCGCISLSFISSYCHKKTIKILVLTFRTLIYLNRDKLFLLWKELQKYRNNGPNPAKN